MATKKKPVKKKKVAKKVTKKPTASTVVKQLEKEIIPTEAELGFDDVELEDEMDELDEIVVENMIDEDDNR